MKKTKIRRTISVKWLQQQGASCPEVERFQREFGDSAKLTLPNLLRATKLHFNLDWLAVPLLPSPLYKDYEKQRATLYEDYKQKLAPLDEDYWKKLASLIWDIVSSAAVGVEV